MLSNAWTQFRHRRKWWRCGMRRPLARFGTKTLFVSRPITLTVSNLKPARCWERRVLHDNDRIAKTAARQTTGRGVWRTPRLTDNDAPLVLKYPARGVRRGKIATKPPPVASISRPTAFRKSRRRTPPKNADVSAPRSVHFTVCQKDRLDMLFFTILRDSVKKKRLDRLIRDARAGTRLDSLHSVETACRPQRPYSGCFPTHHAIILPFFLHDANKHGR